MLLLGSVFIVMGKKPALEGKRFGRLTVLEDDGTRKRKQVYWKCLCDCGNITHVQTTRLTSGHTQSCGCLMKEKARESGKNSCLDLRGYRIGKLVYLEPTNRRQGTNVIWKCKCDCGNITYISTSERKHIQSCGCLISKGEDKLQKILDKIKIKYEKQKKFPDCKYKYHLRFDFYLPEYNTCIEFDGQQHYRPIPTMGGNEKFLVTKERDNIKSEYCKQHNINLIRIPYWDFNVLDADYLLEKLSLDKVKVI